MREYLYYNSPHSSHITLTKVTSRVTVTPAEYARIALSLDLVLSASFKMLKKC